MLVFIHVKSYEQTACVQIAYEPLLVISLFSFFSLSLFCFTFDTKHLHTSLTEKNSLRRTLSLHQISFG